MKLTDFAIRHSVAGYVLTLTIFVLGLVAYVQLPREAAPDITIPVVLVTTPYYGVAPADIESLITHPIEKELKELKDVDKIASTSAQGVSVINVTFTPDVDLDAAVQSMREKVDKARPNLPDDAEDPILTEINFSEFPIMIVNVSGRADPTRLKAVAEELQDRIEVIPGVLDVKMAGGVEREIQVAVDPARLQFYELSLSDVVQALRRENVNLPGGSIDVADTSYLVRVNGEFSDAVPIPDLVIKTRNGLPIFIRDIAVVTDGYKDRSSYSRLNGHTNVSLSVQKRAGENVIRITDEVKRIVRDFEADELPPGMHLTITADVSDMIRDMVSDLENNILSGLILVVAVLLFFMGGVTNSLFVASAIPLSMLISFSVLSLMGITLNMVVLFSLILALGMLVDNAIVIVENIYRHAQMGKTRARAAMDAVSEVGWPVITSTLTTLAAFGPMLFWPGIMGEFMGYLPLTVIIVLSSSLFVALVINPVLCATLMKVKARPESDGAEVVPDHLVYRRYRGILEWALNHRAVTIAASIALLISTFVIYAWLGHGVELFPKTTPRRAFVSVRAPDGTNLDATNTMVSRIEEGLSALSNLKNFVADVGSGGGQAFSTTGSPNAGRITVDFLDTEERTEDPFETIEKIRALTVPIAGAEFEVDSEKMGPPTGKPINIEIVGKDYHRLGEIAAQVRMRIRDIDGIADLKDNYVSGRPEVHILVNRRQAALTGASTFRIADTIRAAINGVVATKIRDGEDEYDVVVRLDRPYRRSIEDIEDLTIPGKKNKQVPLREVASLTTAGGTGSIRHVDLDRVVTVSANVTPGALPDTVLAAARKALADLPLPPGYHLRYTGESEDQAEASAFLSKALMAAMFLIALILVTEFNSILQVLVILGSVIMSLIGVFWGLILAANPFGIIMTGIGVISLAGVVVNNAIVLIDYTNQLRAQGFERRKAVITAGLVRFRPVLLTAVTTILGLVPMVIGVSIDFFKMEIIRGSRSTQMWGPMAQSVTAGLLVATVLTLVIVPVMYTLADDLGAWLRRLFLGRDGEASTQAPSPETSS